MKPRKRAGFGRRSGDPFTLIPRNLLASREWTELRPAARVIFVDMAKRHRQSGGYGPDNNGQIAYGCLAGARAANVSIATASRRMRELHDSGLAKIRNPGAFKVKAGHGRASEWALTVFPLPGGEARFWGDSKLRLEHWLLDSPAYKNLTNQAKCILLELMRRHDGGNNGRISFGGANGSQTGLSTDVTERALAELEHSGFIVQTAPAIAHLSQPPKWRLAMYEADGKPATKDFMRIAPVNEARGDVTGAGESSENISVMRVLLEAIAEPARGEPDEMPKDLRGLATLHPNSNARAGETFEDRGIRASEIHLETSPPASNEPGFAPANISVRPKRSSKLILERSAGLFGDALPSMPTPLHQLRLELRGVLARKRGTQSRLAEALGLTRQTFSNALSGRERFTATAVAALRRWLDRKPISEDWPQLPASTEKPNAA